MVGIGVKMNDKGELVETDFMQMLQKFKIQDAIAAIPNAIRGIFKFVGDFIADPIGIGGPILKSITTNIRDFFINTLKSIVAFFGMGSLAPDFLKSDAEKRLADMEDQRDKLRDEKNAADRELKNFQRANKGLSKGRARILSSLAENAEEISRIESLIESGQVKGQMLGTYNSRLAELRSNREEQIARIKELRLASIQVKTLPNEISALNEQIEELAKAIKEDPAGAATTLLDNRNTNNVSNPTAMFLGGNSGFDEAAAAYVR